MALINTLREKGSKIIIGFIAVAIGSFVLTDLLSGQNSILTGNDRDLAEIAGETISYDQFQKKVDILVSNYVNRYGRNPGADILSSYREEAWLLLVAEKSFANEYAELDLGVGPEELVDMVQGKNISPEIQGSFTDQTTGQFNKDQLLQTLNQLSTSPQGRAQWRQYEQSLIPGRLRIKLDNLLGKSTFVTDAEAEREYKDQNTVAEIKYVHVPFYAISDSVVTVTDADLTSYIKDHKEDYEVDWSRSIEYVSFPILASPQDSLDYRDELRKMKEEFTTITDDSLYTASNSDGGDYFTKYSINTLPVLIASNLNIIKKGVVVGPYIEGNSYVLYKMTDIYEDTVGVARARHILIKWDDDSDEAKAKARTEAKSVLRQVLVGDDFAEVAKEKSKDGGTAINGGNLGWIETGKSKRGQPITINDAVFKASTVGVISRLIESQLGFHIIDVTELASYTKYKIAKVGIEISASDNTRNDAFRKADLFAGTSGNQNDFTTNAEKGEFQILDASSIGPNDESITRIGRARQISAWLFRDASLGEVSPVYELDDQYVVAVMTDEQPEGLANIDLVRLDVTEKVKDEKRGEIITEKLKALSGTLDEIAASYGADASVYSASDIKLSSINISSAGEAPEAIGSVFSLEAGATSLPILTDNGVVIIQLESITPAADIADYSLYSSNLLRNRGSRSSYYLGQLLEKKANVKDERYKFY